MNDQIGNLIDNWILMEKKISNEECDPFIRFFIYYLCLDAWMTSESGEDADLSKLTWLKNKNNPLKDNFISGGFDKSDLESLKYDQKVEDMRPNHRGEFKEITDVSDFVQVVDFIYQIRCNLFHGQKSPFNDKDKSLVSCAGRFLQRWIISSRNK